MNLKEFATHVFPAIKIRIYSQYRYEEEAGDIARDDSYEEEAGDIARDDSYSRLFVVDYIIWEDHIDIFV